MNSSKKKVRFIEKCYQLYEHKMYYIAYSVLNDVQLAEDAVQEAFIHLMKQEIEFEDCESEECKKYIYTVIKNTAIDSYRKKKREQQLMYLADDETLSYKIIEAESKVDIEELTRGLPTKYYEVVHLLAIENLSVKEVANKLGISEANVRKRFERAKKMIQKRSDKNETGRVIYRTIHS